MALYISYASRDREYHVQDFDPARGCKAETKYAIRGTARGVESVQADGDELEYIMKNFAGIPTCVNNRVVSWYGDHAKFIVGNL